MFPPHSKGPPGPAGHAAPLAPEGGASRAREAPGFRQHCPPHSGPGCWRGLELVCGHEPEGRDVWPGPRTPARPAPHPPVAEGPWGGVGAGKVLPLMPAAPRTESAMNGPVGTRAEIPRENAGARLVAMATTPLRGAQATCWTNRSLFIFN